MFDFDKALAEAEALIAKAEENLLRSMMICRRLDIDIQHCFC